MNFFAALLTIASVVAFANAGCPRIPNCPAGKKACVNIGPDGCPYPLNCIEAIGKFCRLR
jgi:hypothetical protein